MTAEAGILERAGAGAERLVKRFMPDPFVLVLLLSIAALGATLALEAAGRLPAKAPAELLASWQRGFSELLSFAMQMVLIVVTGEAIVAAPLPRAALLALARLPRTPAQAVAGVAAVALVLGWLHWGFGLVASAILAREVALESRRKGLAVHFPLVGAAGYMAMLLWHAGTTASAPLLINTKGHFLEKEVGIVPLRETVFTTYNLLACLVLLIVVPAVLAGMHPRGGAVEEVKDPPPAEVTRAAKDEEEAAPTPAQRLDRSRAASLVVGLAGIAFCASYFRANGPDLNHNLVNFLLLSVGLCLHPSPTAYGRAIAASLRGTSGIVLQYPFYGGIMALLREGGLGHLIAEPFVSLASAASLPFCAYLASVATKLFVPSGGGEWAVEGPIMIQAAKALGASVGKTTMGIAYGNMVGNMFQPFWAIPLLAILGLEARAIMGYCWIVFAVALPVLGAALLL